MLWNVVEVILFTRVQAGGALLAVPFCSRALAPLRSSQADFKLPIPGWIAAATHTRCPEHLCAIPQLAICINLLHVRNCHPTVPDSSNTELLTITNCNLSGFSTKNLFCILL